MSYPTSDLTARPYRLWDANGKKQVRWRCYSDPKRAHIGALIEAKFAKVGTSVEVYNANNGRMLGQYTRRLHSVTFLGE